MEVEWLGDNSESTGAFSRNDEMSVLVWGLFVCFLLTRFLDDAILWYIYLPGPQVCGSVSYGIRPIVACLPAWWRFAQCLRRYRDTRLVFPHIVNAGKYSTTFFVVLFSSLNRAYAGKVEQMLLKTQLQWGTCMLVAKVVTMLSFCLLLCRSPWWWCAAKQCIFLPVVNVWPSPHMLYSRMGPQDGLGALR